MNDLDLDIFAQRLKELRTTLGITQKDFASELGITAAALSSYEKNNINPSISVAKRIAEKYHVSIDWLCGLTEKKHRDGEIMTVGDMTSLLLEMGDYIGFNFSIGELDVDKDSSGASITFYNPHIVDFIFEWKKMKDLHDNKIIDDDVYNLWVEKAIEKNKSILLDDSQKD